MAQPPDWFLCDVLITLAINSKRDTNAPSCQGGFSSIRPESSCRQQVEKMEGYRILLGLASFRAVWLQEAPEESTRSGMPTRTSLPAGANLANSRNYGAYLACGTAVKWRC
jgi:hypothetical protein